MEIQSRLQQLPSSQAPAEYTIPGSSKQAITAETSLLSSIAAPPKAAAEQSFSKIVLPSRILPTHGRRSRRHARPIRRQQKLNVLFWYRRPENPQYVFGAQLPSPARRKTQTSLDKSTLLFATKLRRLARHFPPGPSPSPSGFRTTWKRSFVATEIGDDTPALGSRLYLLDPAKTHALGSQSQTHSRRSHLTPVLAIAS